MGYFALDDSGGSVFSDVVDYGSGVLDDIGGIFKDWLDYDLTKQEMKYSYQDRDVQAAQNLPTAASGTGTVWSNPNLDTSKIMMVVAVLGLAITAYSVFVKKK